MKRRQMMQVSLAGAAGAALTPPAVDGAGQAPAGRPVPDARTTAPLPVPANRQINVAFLISADAELVDFAGPWGVFAYALIGDERRQAFNLYTVAASRDAIKVSRGMTIVPNYTFADSPAPDVIVVPAMDNDKLAPAALDWLKAAQKDTDVTMSVCNGAFVLADAGLLDGKKATAHHGGVASLRVYPKVTVVRGRRYVEDGNIATAGGLTSGMDLAMRVVERYFGRDVAKQTATYLEYQGEGWMRPESNAQFAKKPVGTPERPICPVCESRISRAEAVAARLTAEYEGRIYYFCGTWCRDHFVKAPKRFI